MGLDVSHDAFSGAYSAFNRFRQIVAKAWGGSYPPHDDKTLDREWVYLPDGGGNGEHPGLVAFLSSSDCDGEFSPKVAGMIADEMEALLPRIKELDDGGYYAVAVKYIKGCRLAKSKRQKLIYR